MKVLLRVATCKLRDRAAVEARMGRRKRAVQSNGKAQRALSTVSGPHRGSLIVLAAVVASTMLLAAALAFGSRHTRQQQQQTLSVAAKSAAERLIHSKSRQHRRPPGAAYEVLRSYPHDPTAFTYVPVSVTAADASSCTTDMRFSSSYVAFVSHLAISCVGLQTGLAPS